MSGNDSSSFRTLLREALAHVDPPPDLNDVHRRLSRYSWRRRISGTLVGLIVGALGVSILVLTLLPGGMPEFQRTQPPTVPGASRAVGESQDGIASIIPEGHWLLQLGSEGTLEGRNEEGRTLGELVVYDISPDGSKIVATNAQSIDYGAASIFRQYEIHIIDSATGAQTVVSSASSKETIAGPVQWSPDGTRLAHRLGAWDVDLTSVTRHPGPVQLETLCVIELSSSSRTCFPGLHPVLGFDWSPSGDALVVRRLGWQPLLLLELATGRTSVIMPGGGSSSVRDAIRQAGLGEVDVILDPAWSPSGNYIAATAATDSVPSIPIVFTPSGEFVAMGQSSPGAQVLSWSPTSDLLAYSVGALDPDLPGAAWGVRVLDATGRDDNLLLSLDDEVEPAVFNLLWSPSGRWLAVDGSDTYESDTIRIVDMTSGTVTDRVEFDSSGTNSPLVDWGP
jgi:WD40 repeat protein